MAAAKAKAQITISHLVDIVGTTRYYLLQSSTAAAPAKPTTNPPPSAWKATEPSYTEGSTKTLYFVDLTLFTNATFSYSAVSKSSSYEAAKAAYNKAINAEKTATNFLNYDDNGVVIGNMTADTLGKNVLIDADSVDIRNGSTTLATFAKDKIELGKNDPSSVIELCGGVGKMSASKSAGWYDTLFIESNKIDLESHSMSILVDTRKLSPVPAKYSRGQFGMAVGEDGVIGMWDISYNDEKTAYVEMLVDPTDSWISFYADAGVCDMTKNGIEMYNGRNIYINGVKHTGKNKVLWSGGYYMTSGHTATLSEKISEQPHGVCLIFSRYDPSGSGVRDFSWSYHFVPKHATSFGSGHTFQMRDSKFYLTGTKYLYISDTAITGNDDNTATGTASGITYNNNRYVLRYVIGV